jgi:pSer/pThr/pTyr-binding forkhead associated (FHA) protein
LSAIEFFLRNRPMMLLEIAGVRVPVAAGETIIGSAPGCAILLEGEGVQPQHAVLHGTAQGAAAIRSATPEAELLVNGVRLGSDPTPVLHGDKIQIGRHEILAVDPRRAGNTQLFDSGAFTDLVPAPRPVSADTATAPTGGRVVCLTDGREYTVGANPLVFGRDAGSDVVVAGNDVSRRHAEIQSSPEGYVLMDVSVNGTYVNGERVGRRYLLARADVIRIGHDEFRFYADAAPPPGLRPPRGVPAATPVRPPTGAGARLSDTMHGLPQSELKTAVTPTAPTVAPLASFLIRNGSLKGKRLPVKVPIVNIGRADYNDVVLADPSVSTSHAKLQRRDDVWVLSDVGSTNGTFVENERVTGEIALSPGSTVRFGEVSVLWEPFDQPSANQVLGTKLVEAIDVAPSPPAEARPEGSGRRPIRPPVPRPGGPPAWVLVAIALIGAALAYFLMR